MSEGTTPAEGQVAPNWYEGADADTIGFVQNKKWDTPLKAVEAYRNLEKFHGVPAEQIVKLPPADDVEAWGKVYNRLGRPETPDKYGLDGVKVPEGQEIIKDFLEGFDQKAHAAGLTKAQRDMLTNWYIETNVNSQQKDRETIAQQRAADMTELKSEWGQHFDERLELGRRVLRQALPQGSNKETLAAMVESVLGQKEAAKLFANIGDMIGEDKFVRSENERAFGYTAEQATNDKNTLMSELRADPVRLANYNKAIGPDYDKMQRLIRIISGNA